MTQLIRTVTADKASELVSTITVSELTVSELYKRMSKLDSKVATYTFELSELQEKLAKWQRGLNAAKTALIALETAEYNASFVRVISYGKKSAQIVVTTKNEDGKKVSQTRHLRKEGDHYTGHSMFGLRIIRWDLNKTEPIAVAEAA